MTCLSDGLLRSQIDRELEGEPLRRVEEHLLSCESCRARRAEMVEAAARVRMSLNALSPAVAGAAQDPAEAYLRFRRQISAVSKPPVFALWRKPLGGALAAGIALAFLISFAPARSWGQHILSMLRIQKVAVVPLDLSALATDTKNGGSTGKLLAQMISDSVVVTEKPGEPQTVSDVGSASHAAGFDVRSLSDLGSPQKIVVRGEGAFHTTLDRSRMQDLLDQVGRSDIQIPASAGGSTIAVHTSKLVHLMYGNCPTEKAVAGCISLIETRTPVVSVPPNLDLPALAEAGLQVAGMSAAETHAFSQTVNWSSTLVIPIPQIGSSFRTVAVDGVDGTLIETAARGQRPSEYSLLWVNDGMVYSLHGSGDLSRALTATASLN